MTTIAFARRDGWVYDYPCDLWSVQAMRYAEFGELTMFEVEPDDARIRPRQMMPAYCVCIGDKDRPANVGRLAMEIYSSNYV